MSAGNSKRNKDKVFKRRFGDVGEWLRSSSAAGGLTPITLDSRTWNPGDPVGLLLEDNPEDILLDIEGQHLRFQKDNALEGALAAMTRA